MPKINLKTMSLDALIGLQKQISTEIDRHRAQLKKTLSQIDGGTRRAASAIRGATKHSPLLGRKVKPKYRNPRTGETWAGRGAKPRWMGNEDPGQFLITSSRKRAA